MQCNLVVMIACFAFALLVCVCVCMCACVRACVRVCVHGCLLSILKYINSKLHLNDFYFILNKQERNNKLK